MKYLMVFSLFFTQSIWAQNEDDYLALIESEAQNAQVTEINEWTIWHNSARSLQFLEKLRTDHKKLYQSFQSLPEKHRVAILRALEEERSFEDIRFMILSRKQSVVGL